MLICFNWKRLYKIYIFSSDQMFLIDRALGCWTDHYLNMSLYLSGRHRFPFTLLLWFLLIEELCETV